MRPGARARLPRRRRQARRDRLRRWSAALLAGLAAFVVVTALGSTRSAQSGVTTLVAGRDLPAGTVLARDDVVVTTRPAGQRPATGLTAYGDVIGRVTAGPVAARDVLTRERLVGGGLLAGQPDGHVALTIPVLGGATTGLVPGVHVDIYSTGTGQRTATDVVVLALSRPRSSASGMIAGSATGSEADASVTVALPASDAGRVATSLSAIQAGDSFVLAVRRS